MEPVLVLNYDYQLLNKVNWKKALKLVLKSKAEVLVYSDTTITNYEKTRSFKLPKILRLLKMIKEIFTLDEPWSKRNVLFRDNYECGYCLKKLTENNYTVDHVIPKSRGGKSTFENTVAACERCNHDIKQGKTLKESGLTLKKKLYTPTVMEFIRKKARLAGFDVEDILKQSY